MKDILLLDTSIGSLNKGDEIIMECVREELKFITKNNFVLNVPTHLPAFHAYQVWRNSIRVNIYKNAYYKFVGGSNILISNLLTHFPQWNLNIFNYKPLADCILVGVGAGSSEKTNRYTKYVYKRLLNQNLYHSVRDERSKRILENYGAKALNTGCVTMWKLTPEFCKNIPIKKSDTVVFTLTSTSNFDIRDQKLINTLNRTYKNVYFWPQGIDDYNYFNKMENINNIKILDSSLESYRNFLIENDTDYVGTRLHGGVYAMRHKKRAIIVVIDERAREINKSNNLNCIEKDKIDELEKMIFEEIKTEIIMPFETIEKWKSQFK